MMAAVDLVSLPSHLVGQCSDMHIRMMHIQHPAKQQQDLESFYKLREEESFCDMTFVTTNGEEKGRKSIKVHSLVIAASSDFLKNWMETTFVADLKYEVILPDTDFTNLESLINILYGVDVAVPQNRLDQLHNLADMLGITVDLPFRIVEQSFNDVDVGDMNGGDQLNQVSNLVTMSVGGEKPPEFKDLEDENAGVDVLPLCCWHCNRAFADLEELKTHVKTHKGERFKSKRHKCQKCKKILPSMWKLRQHLLTHASSMPKRRYVEGPAADHGYATSEKHPALVNSPSNSQHNLSAHGTPQKDASKDHPYATMQIPRTGSNLQNDAVDTPPLSLVSSEHSYGTRLKNNQEEEGASGNLDLMGGSNSRDRRYDHPYSAWENPTSKPPKTLPSPSITPKKLKLKSKRMVSNKKLLPPTDDIDISSKNLSIKTKRVRTLSSRLRRRDEERARKANDENTTNVAEIMDHQYASNQNSENDFHISPKRYSVTNSEPPSNPPTRTPSPPRGAAKRKASLNLQRAKSRLITASNDQKVKQLKVQFEQSQTTEHTIEEPIHSIVDISNLNPQDTQINTKDNSHLVVRLHPLKAVTTSIHTGALPNKLPIPALPNSRTRAGAKKKGPTETNFPCSQCTKIFPQRYRRARHIREVHDKEKRHQCGTCEKSFFKITSKERHELTHLKNRTTQWNCTLCSRSFSDESSLVYHVKNRVCVKRGIVKL